MTAARHPVASGIVRPRRKIRWNDLLAPYLFILPFVLFFFVLFLGPAIYSLVLSFYRYKGYGGATFLGLANYRAILTYHVFWTELWNTVFYWLAHVFPLMIIAFLLALLVRSKLVRGKSFYKPMIFLPNVLITVGAALVFQTLFGTEYGTINQLLGTHIAWLQSYSLTRWVVVFLLIWQGMGWWFIIYLAGLTSINPDLEEAALVDGASGWQRLLTVTIPLMRNTFLFAFVLDAITSFRLFTQPNVIVAHQGAMAPDPVAPILNLLVGNLQGADFGKASAVGWILFILVAIITFIQFQLFRGSEEAA